MSYNNIPIFRINEKLIQEIQPDLIIGQDLCSVCAPYTRETKTVTEILGYEPKNLILNPKTLSEVFESIVTIGKEVGNLDNAYQLKNRIQNRAKELESIIKRFGKLDESVYMKENILCLDWISPFFVAGHWVPEMIQIAGGNSLNKGTGTDSNRITIKDIAKLAPDKIIIAPCGFNLDRTIAEYERLGEFEWASLKAVRDKQVYVVDSGSYFSKPSPRLITGIEILCKIINPEIFRDLPINPGSVLRI